MCRCGVQVWSGGGRVGERFVRVSLGARRSRWWWRLIEFMWLLERLKHRYVGLG